MKKSDLPIIVESHFDSSPETVWNALTNIKLMTGWYFNNIPDFIPEVGFETQFNVQSEVRNFLHKWKVTEAEKFKVIKYTWEFDEYYGKSTSAFEIFKHGDGTLLRLTVDVLEDFPEDIPEFKRESCIAGWEYFLNQRLKEFLNNFDKVRF